MADAGYCGYDPRRELTACFGKPECSVNSQNCPRKQTCFSYQDFVDARNQPCVDQLNRFLPVVTTTARPPRTTVAENPPPAPTMTTVQGLPQSGEPGSGPTGDSSDGQLSGSGDVNSAGGVLITATVKSAGGPVINSPSSTPVTIGSSASSESGSGSGLGIGIGLALIVLAVGGFVFAKKQRQRKEVAAAPDSTFPSEYTAAPVQKAIITPAYAAPIPTAGAAAVITAGVIPSAKRSILFLYDTDYTPSAQICQEIEHVLWAKLAARQRVVATRRLGLQGLPEDIQLFQLGEFDSIVLVLRKAERFKIYREGKIFDRLQDLCGSKLITVIFDVVMQNGNMDAQRHDGFPLVYFSAADRKVVPTRENDDTLTQLAEQLL